MPNNFSFRPLSVSHPLSRLESAFEAVEGAGHVSTPDQMRGLLRSLDSVCVSFGVDCPVRAPAAMPVEALPVEVALAIRRLKKLPDSTHEALLVDLEEALAQKVPVASMVHVVRSRLWKQDRAAWVQALACVLIRVKDEETCKMLTAVISQHAIA
jgi:hypothetical protein